MRPRATYAASCECLSQRGREGDPGAEPVRDMGGCCTSTRTNKQLYRSTRNGSNRRARKGWKYQERHITEQMVGLQEARGGYKRSRAEEALGAC